MNGMNQKVAGMRGHGKCVKSAQKRASCRHATHATNFVHIVTYGGDIQNKLTVYPPPWRCFMEVLQAALRYTARGVAAIPVYRDRRKNPYLSTYTEFYMRLPTWENWRRWANRWPLCNIALITGYWGVCALDFDTEASYQAWVDGPGWGIRGQGWTTKTARGYHFWFDVQGDPGESRMYTNGEHEVLLRAKGGYCIVPPSIHHSGVPYRTVHRVEPWQTDNVEYYLRGWALKTEPAKIGRQGEQVFTNGASRIEQLIAIPEGSKPNGRGAYQVRCPFHDDQKPSAWLNVEQQRFGCNACWPGQWWDVVNIISMLKGVSNSEAFREFNHQI